MPPADASLKLRRDYQRWRYTIRHRVLALVSLWINEYGYYFEHRYTHARTLHILLLTSLASF